LADNQNRENWQMSDNKTNLTPFDFPKLDWSPAATPASLELLYEYTKANGERASNWYFDRVKWRKYGARILRGMSIIFPGIAAIVPIGLAVFGTLTPGEVPKHWYTSPMLSSFAIAIAALLIMIDRFWGFSSSWTRFILAGTEIKHALEKFQYQWNEQQLAWETTPPSNQQASEMVILARTFLTGIQEIVGKETREWADEFKQVLSQIEKEVKATFSPEKTGAIQVDLKVSTGKVDSWAVFLDGPPRREATGNSFSLIDLKPKIYNVELVATIDGTENSSTKAVQVKEDQISPVVFEF
jgi:SMODS and SLOG-associating 2TM effector domain 2